RGGGRQAEGLVPDRGQPGPAVAGLRADGGVSPMTAMPSPPDPLESLDHATLARLVPDLLLIGQLIDRAGMPALLSEFGMNGMRDVAIEEWQAASPHYAKRMKETLGITGDGVAEIFKGFQLDVGAPDRKSTRLNSSHVSISYAVFFLNNNN